MESYVCPRCSGLVSVSRREAHDSEWCPAVEEGPECKSAPARGEGADRQLGGVRGALSSLCQEVVAVGFGSIPGLVLSLEQVDIWGPADTGGALWYGDRVMAEYLAFGDAVAESGGAGAGCAPPGGVALVLGCGGVPLSGLLASALGWDVVLTDLGVVLEQTKANVARNLETMRLARSKRRVAEDDPSGDAPVVRVVELPFGEEAALDAALDSVGVAPGQPVSGRLFVLCSDCIWKQELHKPMLQTISSALRRAGPGGSEALVCFQSRSPTVEKLFQQRMRDEALGLRIEQIDLSQVLPMVQWPPQVSKVVSGVDLEREFQMYRLTVPTEA